MQYFLISFFLFTSFVYAEINDFSDITNRPRAEKRKRPGHRYPFKVGRLTYLNIDEAPQIKILGSNSDQTKVKVKFLSGRYEGTVEQVNAENVVETKGCYEDFCIGDDILLYTIDGLRAKLVGYVLEHSYNRGRFTVEYADRRFPHLNGKMAGAVRAYNVYKTVGCGTKMLCVGDRVLGVHGYPGNYYFLKGDIKGVNLEGQYVTHYVTQAADVRNFDIRYSQFALLEKDICGRDFCFNDGVIHKDHPNDRAVIKGIHFNGKYLIIFGEGPNKGKFKRWVKDGALKLISNPKDPKSRRKVKLKDQGSQITSDIL